jgi:hypothetical protein
VTFHWRKELHSLVVLLLIHISQYSLFTFLISTWLISYPVIVKKKKMIRNFWKFKTRIRNRLWNLNSNANLYMKSTRSRSSSFKLNTTRRPQWYWQIQADLHPGVRLSTPIPFTLCIWIWQLFWWLISIYRCFKFLFQARSCQMRWSTATCVIGIYQQKAPRIRLRDKSKGSESKTERYWSYDPLFSSTPFFPSLGASFEWCFVQ